MTELQKYRKQLHALLNYLHGCLPEDAELNRYRAKLELGMDADPRGVAQGITSCLAPYVDHILKGDDSFFVGADLTVLGVDPSYLAFAHKLRDIWLGLDAGQHNQVKKYFKILLMRGCLVIQDPDLLTAINRHRDANSQLSF